MAPLKVWAPSERLTSADLNAAFAEVAGNRMPGVFCEQGAVQALTAGQTKELPAGAPNPAATWDPAGFWNGATSRLVVPAGMAGVYLATAAVSVTGGAKGDLVRIWMLGTGTGAAVQQAPLGGIAGYGATLTLACYLTVGAIVYINGYSDVACSVRIEEFTLVRLGALGLFT